MYILYSERILKTAHIFQETWNNKQERGQDTLLAIMFLDLLDDPADEPSFTQLVKQYENYVFAVCKSRTKTIEDAEDCTWQTFEQAAKDFKKFGNIRSKKSKNLLCTMAIAKCKKFYRNKSIVVEQMSVSYEEDIPAGGSTPEKEYFQNYEVERIVIAMQSLPEEYKQALFLREVHGYTEKEIADLCGIPYSTARKRISDGRKKVRKLLEEGSSEND